MARKPATKTGRKRVGASGKKPAAAKSGAKRHQALALRKEFSQELTDPAIRRVLRRGGVKRISKPAYNEMRRIAFAELSNVLIKAEVFMVQGKRTNMRAKDIVAALKKVGVHLGAVDNVGGEVFSAAKKASDAVHKKVHKAGVKKAHKFKPGTVALREIVKLQKSDAHVIPRAPFARLVQGLAARDHLTGKISLKAVECLRLFLENQLVSIAESANLEALHAKRVTVMEKDIRIALRVKCAARGSGCGDIHGFWSESQF